MEWTPTEAGDDLVGVGMRQVRDQLLVAAPGCHCAYADSHFVRDPVGHRHIGVGWMAMDVDNMLEYRARHAVHRSLQIIRDRRRRRTARTPAWRFARAGHIYQRIRDQGIIAARCTDVYTLRLNLPYGEQSMKDLRYSTT